MAMDQFLNHLLSLKKQTKEMKMATISCFYLITLKDLKKDFCELKLKFSFYSMTYSVSFNSTLLSISDHRRRKNLVSPLLETNLKKSLRVLLVSTSSAKFMLCNESYLE